VCTDFFNICIDFELNLDLKTGFRLGLG